MTATFQTISSTREEYITTIENLKASAPPEVKGRKKTKIEASHLSLIATLENRIEAIDTEIAVCNLLSHLWPINFIFLSARSTSS